MINRYSKTNFYKLNSVDGILEYDLVDNHWDLFKIKRELQYYTVGSGFEQRPDLLALKIYGTIDPWYILCKYNLIDDIWNDILMGTILACPNILDIDDFYVTVKQFNKTQA